MTQRVATHFPSRTPAGVRSLTFDARVGPNRLVTAEFGAPVALDADGILNDQSVEAATTVTTFAAAYSSDNMGPWGRNVTIVASGAATSTVSIVGRDYLQQPVKETLTLNGTNTVQGVKAFKYIDSVVVLTTTSSTTVDIGWGNRLGLPLKGLSMVAELKNDAVAANAGTFVAGLLDATTSTATTADPRGYYLPATVLPDGSNTFQIIYVADVGNLHGNAQYYA